MDIKSLYDREVAYYTGRSVVVYLVDTRVDIQANAVISKTDTGVRTTITAPYSPTTLNYTIPIKKLQVLNKPLGVPASYVGVFTGADTATLTPVPQLTVNQEVLIGVNTYKVVQITGSTVKFERSVGEALTFVAAVVSETVTYQWQIVNNGVWQDISGATEREYEPIPSDVGKDLRVIVTYTDGRGEVGQTVPVPPTSFVGSVNITPLFPIIAEIELDVARTYAPNTINTFVIEIDSV